MAKAHSKMPWLDEVLERLADKPCCGYVPDGSPAVEPTALAALALVAHGLVGRAKPALNWLADVQSTDGSLGINASQPRPCWATGWALLAWSVAPGGGSRHSKPLEGKRSDLAAGQRRWAAAARKAAEWILSTRSEPKPSAPMFGHDPALQAWPWVEGTFSWVEPTAINVLGLKASGRGAHPHTREAVRMLLDRMLPSGGWNYGNPVVLGQTLRPNVQPTGLALAALGSEEETASRVKPSIGYLHRTLSAGTTTASLCYALMGMTCQRHRPAEADRWLEAACRRTLRRDGSPYKLALAALAASDDGCPPVAPQALAGRFLRVWEAEASVTTEGSP